MDVAKAAYINSQVACSLIALEAFKQGNREQEAKGLPPRYNEDDIAGLMDAYCVGHNAVLDHLYRRR